MHQAWSSSEDCGALPSPARQVSLLHGVKVVPAATLRQLARDLESLLTIRYKFGVLQMLKMFGLYDKRF